MFFRLYVFFLTQLVHLSLADHYKGGSISWKPTNPYAISGSTVAITITERHSWTYTRYPCNESTINTFGAFSDTQASVPAAVTCISSSAACTTSLYVPINSSLYCTDFSTVFGISSGIYYTTQDLAINSVFDIASRGASWATETLTNSWSLVSHIDLTPISGKINTSPVTGSIPIFQTFVNELVVMPIIVGDIDTDQEVRCRWSYQLPLDECGNVCFDLPNAQLNAIDCFITWTPVLREEDIANGLTRSTYVVAITAEDFANASSTTALSSVPHQVLVYVSSRPAGTCSTKPTLSVNGRRNGACYAVTVGTTTRFNFQGSVSSSCPNASIVNFVSSTPFFTNHSVIYQQSNFTWTVNMTWFANTNLTGLQPFCVAAVDNHGQTSNQYCVMIMVGGVNPILYTPSFVQSTASPVGTVMATHTRFSIQANMPLRRSMLDGTYIRIYRLNPNALNRQIDIKNSPDVFFLNNTLVFYVTNPTWTLGQTYYITMTEGVGTADRYCGTEYGAISGSTVWRFTIWNPSASLTTTPSTTTSTATTHTVTTRSMGTTTYNTLFTTTGIPAYTTTTTTSTTSTTSTSVTTTTTTSATTTTTSTTTTTEYIPNADVLYPKELERECLQPITIMVVLITAAVVPLHFYGMINLFVKMNSHFQKETLRRRNIRRMRLRSALDLEEEQTFV